MISQGKFSEKLGKNLENFLKKKSKFKKNGKNHEKIMKKLENQKKKIEKMGKNQRNIRLKIYFLQYLENGKRQEKNSGGFRPFRVKPMCCEPFPTAECDFRVDLISSSKTQVF